MLATGHITATHASAGGASASQLDQGKITKTKFRVETVTLTAKDKIKLRGLFQEAGLTAKASDDLSAKSTELLDLMVLLAGKAGGAAPPSRNLQRQLMFSTCVRWPAMNDCRRFLPNMTP